MKSSNPPKSIPAEILEWSQDRPAWQRDALRRLFTTGQIIPADLDELVTLCKAAQGLSKASAPSVLAKSHLGIKGRGTDPVTLVSVTHKRGVNALAPDQTLTFGTNLTVIYGMNAAGKSGYTRILKRACRSRFTEDILGNVLSGETPLKAEAAIRFREGTTETVFTWAPDGASADELTAVSVFDAHCVPAYLKDKTDVAFRPFGLDVFDKLSSICGEVRSRLESEVAKLSVVTPGLPSLVEGTRARALVDSLTSLTNVDDVRALGTLSPEEERRAKDLRERLRDLQAANPKQRAAELRLRAERMDLVVNHITGLADVFGDAGLATIRSATDALRIAREALALLRKTALTSDLLPGSGEVAWRKMWDAAGAFSGTAYPGTAFPVLTPDARCPLCQQVVGADAAERLQHFAEYVTSTAQAEVRKAEAEHEAALASAAQAVIDRQDIKLAVSELDSDNPNLAGKIRDFLQSAARVQSEIKIAAAQGRETPAQGLSLGLDKELRAGATVLRDRAKELQGQSLIQEPTAAAELNELEARVTLRTHLPAVIAEIERQKQIAAYKLCLEDTQTQPITRKSTELTKRLVTDQLRKTFQEELSKLEFTHLAVEIQTAGGTKGTLFHRLAFSNAPGVIVTEVLSEGESRTLSLAAFLTELSTASSDSAIIFDDPVSSLDHIWRERIAHRLVAEAKKRQVIVFTHDILFLRLLLDECSKQETDYQQQYVRRDGQAGIASPDLPWIAMSIRERIGTLRSRWQAGEKLSRTAGAEAYERDARDIYGLMREAWEQAISEVLLNDVVQRYRHRIESQKVRFLHDITEADCKIVEGAMSECSRWMRGHDHPAADGTPFPTPAELKTRIEELETWVQGIRKRR